MDGAVIRFLMGRSLSQVYSIELAKAFQRNTSSHRFFPIIQAVLQMAVHQGTFLIESLLATTAYMMAAAVPELQHSLVTYGHRSTVRATKELRLALEFGGLLQRKWKEWNC